MPAPSGVTSPAPCDDDGCAPRVVKQPIPRDGKELERIVGATPARIVQGKELVPALAKSFAAVGLTTGRPLFVRYARIGVQDEIGVLTHSKSTVILVGERPGLGTGDSLSIYTAYGPRLNQDNAEKNCISNIRPLGLPPLAAARECAVLMRKTFELGGGGLALVRPAHPMPKRPQSGSGR